KLVDLFQASVGLSRDDLEAALSAVEVAPREQRLRDGLAKLLDDRASWSAPSELDPERARREVFLRATAARRELVPGARFDRDAVVVEVAAGLGVGTASLERALYADLRGASVLSVAPPVSPAALVDVYERSQAQAVLLRAVRIKVGVRCASPGVARALFR